MTPIGVEIKTNFLVLTGPHSFDREKVNNQVDNKNEILFTRFYICTLILMY